MTRKQRMTRVEFRAWLKRMGACDEAVRWVGQKAPTPGLAWRTCPRSLWMLFALRRISERLAERALRARSRALDRYRGGPLGGELNLAAAIRKAAPWREVAKALRRREKIAPLFIPAAE